MTASLLNDSITENGKNTEKSPGDLRRLAVTQTPMKNHQLILNKGKDLLFANKLRIVSWRIERMPQRIQRHSRITLHRSTDPKWVQDKTEKSSYGLDWLQKGIWYGPTKLDNTLSQSVQNITWSHKLHRRDHENMERGADSRRKKHSWNKDPKRHFRRRYTITLTIHNSHDATEPHTQKMRGRIQTQQISREDQPPNVHGWH